MIWQSKNSKCAELGDRRTVTRFAILPKQVIVDNEYYTLWLDYYQVEELYREMGDGGSVRIWWELEETRRPI